MPDALGVESVTCVRPSSEPRTLTCFLLVLPSSIGHDSEIRAPCCGHCGGAAGDVPAGKVLQLMIGSCGTGQADGLRVYGEVGPGNGGVQSVSQLIASELGSISQQRGSIWSRIGHGAVRPG